jgi:hypothetical protein
MVDPDTLDESSGTTQKYVAQPHNVYKGLKVLNHARATVGLYRLIMGNNKAYKTHELVLDNISILSKQAARLSYN